MEGLLEGKSITTCPTRYDKCGWGQNGAGWTPVERRAAVEQRDRIKAVEAIDQEQHPRIRPPPLRTRVDHPEELVTDLRIDSRTTHRHSGVCKDLQQLCNTRLPID